MKKYLKLLRVKHYIKNLLILFPLVFSKNITSNNVIITLLGFFTFCGCSSIIYIINDIMDVDKDRNHPTKKNRPIASGEISIKKAIAVALVLLLAVIGITIYLSNRNNYISLYIIIYIILNLGYSFGLKKKPLIDITILASGFLIRVLYGGALINVEVSAWLFLTILSLAFYLGLGKRRNELIYNQNLTKGKDSTREVLKYYNKDFLDKNMYMFLAITIVFYSLWCKDMPSSKYMMWTIPIVMLICMKYSLNIEFNQAEGGDPVEVIFKDKSLICLIIIYGISIVSVLYIGG